MKKFEYKSYDDLPLFLNVELVSKVLGVSPSSGYELMHEAEFPTLRIGSRMVVPEDRKTYQCYASYKTIGRVVRMSVNTVAKYVRELEDRKLIHTEPTMIRRDDGTPRNGTLLYTILPIQCAVDEYHQRQLHQAELDAQRRRSLELQEEYDRRHPTAAPCGPSGYAEG